MTTAAEWLNQNSQRNYPIQEDQGRAPFLNGVYVQDSLFPNFILVDALFTLPGTTELRLYMSQFSFAGNMLAFVFSTTQGEVVASLAVDRATHKPNTAYGVTGSGSWFDARGWITIGDLGRLDEELPQGLYTFDKTQTLLEARCIRPAVRGVRSLSISNLGSNSGFLSGHVRLVAGANIALRYDSSINGIWIDASPNAGYQEACACASVASTNLVRTINGIPLQDVQIVGDGECVQVTTNATSGVITISDKCSTPCCGCPELEFLNSTIDTISASLNTLEKYSQQLNTRITTFVNNYLLTIVV